MEECVGIDDTILREVIIPSLGLKVFSSNIFPLISCSSWPIVSIAIKGIVRLLSVSSVITKPKKPFSLLSVMVIDFKPDAKARSSASFSIEGCKI